MQQTQLAWLTLSAVRNGLPHVLLLLRLVEVGVRPLPGRPRRRLPSTLLSMGWLIQLWCGRGGSGGSLEGAGLVIVIGHRVLARGCSDPITNC